MSKARLLLSRLESKWAIAALVAVLLVAVALWSVWSWNEARHFVSRGLSQQNHAAQLPLSIMLDNAEARLRAVSEKPKFIRDSLLLGAGDGIAEGIIVAPNVALVSASLKIPVAQAIANRRDGRPGLSLPFQLDGSWRAIMATLDEDGHVLAATIEIERLNSLWKEIGVSGNGSSAVGQPPLSGPGVMLVHGRSLL
jgi:hypothetical protein